MRVVIILLAWALTACAAPPRIEPGDGERELTIYVVSHGWHTGIVIGIDDIPPGACAEAQEFPHASFIEVGWGDRGYYRHPDPGIGTASRAALFGGPGVLHLVGLDHSPRVEFPQSVVVAMLVSRQGMRRLCAYVAASFERDVEGKPRYLGPGLYGVSRFYGSRERFHLFNTCNIWTARALREAGLPIGPSLTADGVLADARDHAKGY